MALLRIGGEVFGANGGKHGRILRMAGTLGNDGVVSCI
jgi:hypothetical protein